MLGFSTAFWHNHRAPFLSIVWTQSILHRRGNHLSIPSEAVVYRICNSPKRQISVRFPCRHRIMVRSLAPYRLSYMILSVAVATVVALPMEILTECTVSSRPQAPRAHRPATVHRPSSHKCPERNHPNAGTLRPMTWTGPQQ